MRPPLAPLASRASAGSSWLVSSLPPETFAALAAPETTLAPLNVATEPWVRSLVWTDFRVAVSFFVVAPFAVLAWSVAARWPVDADADRSPTAEVVLRYMTSYWQASSLLLLTVCLNIQESPAGVAAGLAAQAMICASLWWWRDLNDELKDAPSGIGLAFGAWRAVATIAAAGGVAAQVPFQRCVAAPSLIEDGWCAAWLEPPKFAAGLTGLDASPALDAVATAGCGLYVAVLAYYVVVLLPTVGRRGRAKRPALMDAASPIGAWTALGFLDRAA